MEKFDSSGQKINTIPLPDDASTETTLALIKTKTDNLDIALSGIKTGTDKIPASPSTEGGNLASIKAKTDNLDILLSALRDAITAAAPNNKTLNDLYTILNSLLTELGQKTEPANLQKVAVYNGEGLVQIDAVTAGFYDSLCVYIAGSGSLEVMSSPNTLYANTVLETPDGDSVMDDILDAVKICDGGNVITVDGTIDVASSALPTGAATSALQLPDGHNVTVDNAGSAAAVNIQDGGNTITVDGTVTVGSITAGDNNIGNVDVESSALPTGAATSANQTTIIGHLDGVEGLLTTIDADTGNIATSVGVMDDWDNTASDGASVSGDVAHDGVDAGEPVKIGAKVETSPKGITLCADGDRTNLYADADGLQMAKLNTSFADIISQRVTDATGTSTAFANFGAVASTYNYITSIVVYNSSATAGYIDFRDGTAGSILWTMPLPAGGGAVISSAVPLFRTSASTALAYDVSAALTTIYISISGFQSKC